jgi:hypothetical protein
MASSQITRQNSQQNEPQNERQKRHVSSDPAQQGSATERSDAPTDDQSRGFDQTKAFEQAEARRNSGATGGQQPTETMRESNPPRSSEPAKPSAEVPLGTGEHPEPPGGGGRASQRKLPKQQR